MKPKTYLTETFVANNLLSRPFEMEPPLPPPSQVATDKPPLKRTQRMVVDVEKKKKKLPSCESQKPTYFGYSVYYLARPNKLIFKNEVRLFPCGSLDADIRMGVSQISDDDKAALTKCMSEVVQSLPVTMKHVKWLMGDAKEEPFILTMKKYRATVFNRHGLPITRSRL